MITVDQLYQIIDGVAPFSLSDRFVKETGGYDNSGIMIRAGKEESEAVLFSLDLSDQTLCTAKKIGAKIIVTHHPAIWKGVERLDGSTSTASAITDCIESGISVISAHLNADACAGGVDGSLASGLGANDCTMQIDFGGGAGYGRAFDVQKQTLANFTEKLKQEFDTQNVIVYGDGQKPIARVGSFCGAGADEDAVRYCKQQNCDVMVSADFSHHVVCEAVASGIAVVHMTHYACETYGFYRVYQNVKKQIGESAQCEYFTDRRLL